MITEKDLQAAIAECQSQKNPNANTCLKLASYYTILDNMFPENPPMNEPTKIAQYSNDTEFSRAVRGMDLDDILPIMDELMEATYVYNKPLYNATIKRLKEQG